MPRKPTSENVVCLYRWIFLQTFQTYFCIHSNSEDPDQTAPRGANSVDPDQTGAVWPGPHCLQKWLLNSQADGKADDNCCDWQFKACFRLFDWGLRASKIQTIVRIFTTNEYLCCSPILIDAQCHKTCSCALYTKIRKRRQARVYIFSK